MGKFAERGLAQSLPGENRPQNMHLAWVNFVGAIRNRTYRVLDPRERFCTSFVIINLRGAMKLPFVLKWKSSKGHARIGS